MRLSRVKRLARFIFAGGIGFVADAAALWLLLAVTPLGPFIARVLSIGFALCVTWQINRHLTFSPSSRGVAQEGARYGGVGIATSIVNYLVYCALLDRAAGDAAAGGARRRLAGRHGAVLPRLFPAGLRPLSRMPGNLAIGSVPGKRCIGMRCRSIPAGDHHAPEGRRPDGPYLHRLDRRRHHRSR